MAGLRMQGTQKLPAGPAPMSSTFMFVDFGVSLEIKAHSSAIDLAFVPRHSGSISTQSQVGTL